MVRYIFKKPKKQRTNLKKNQKKEREVRERKRGELLNTLVTNLVSDRNTKKQKQNKQTHTHGPSK